MKNNFILFVFLLLILVGVAQAKDVYDMPEVTPIINRLYPSKGELALKLAYFPIGAFNKHVGVGASYLRLDSPNHGWEVLSGYYFIEMPSGLKNTVIERFGAQAQTFPVLKYMVKTGYNYVPFYSKSILFNSYLIHSRTFLNVSAGLSDYQIEKPAFVSFGYGQNFYFGKNKAVNFDVAYVNFIRKSSYIQNQLTISFGMVFAWGSESE